MAAPAKKVRHATPNIRQEGTHMDMAVCVLDKACFYSDAKQLTYIMCMTNIHFSHSLFLFEAQTMGSILRAYLAH